MNNIASGDGNYLYLNSIIGNNNGNKAKYITFYKTHSSLGLLMLTAYYSGSSVVVANDNSTFIDPDYKFPSSKSNCNILNKWHVISVTWSNRRNLSNCWSDGENLMTFNTGNAKGYNHCIIGDIGRTYVKSHLIGCIGEIIGFYRSLTDTGNFTYSPIFDEEMDLSQLIRYARCCSSYSDLLICHRALVKRLLSQGYKVNRLSNTFKKFYGRHTDLVGQYKKNVCQMFADSIS